MSDTETGTEIVPAAIIRVPGTEPGLSAEDWAAIGAGVPEGTRRSYEKCWREFTRWCADTGRSPLPAGIETMIKYIRYLCYDRPVRDRRGNIIPGLSGMSPSSVKQARWAVIKAHELAGAPFPREKLSLSVIKGYEETLIKAHDPRSKPAKAKAITRDELRDLATVGLEEASPLIAARDRALFFLNFCGAARVSELAAIDIGDVQFTGYGLLLSMYRGKTKSSYEDVAIIGDEAPETVRAVTTWIAMLKETGRENGPLFPRISRTGKTARYGSADGRMTVRSIEERFKLAQEAAGLKGRISVHSGRRGFATAARLAGHDKIRIARHGGWSDDSSALNGYMEDADRVQHNPLRGVGI